MANTYVLNC